MSFISSERELCPKCGERKGVPIVYGLLPPLPPVPKLPDPDYAYHECIVEEEQWHCNACRHNWRDAALLESRGV